METLPTPACPYLHAPRSLYLEVLEGLRAYARRYAPQAQRLAARLRARVHDEYPGLLWVGHAVEELVAHGPEGAVGLDALAAADPGRFDLPFARPGHAGYWLPERRDDSAGTLLARLFADPARAELELAFDLERLQANLPG